MQVAKQEDGADTVGPVVGSSASALEPCLVGNTMCVTWVSRQERAIQAALTAESSRRRFHSHGVINRLESQRSFAACERRDRIVAGKEGKRINPTNNGLFRIPGGEISLVIREFPRGEWFAPDWVLRHRILALRLSVARSRNPDL